MMPPLVSVVIPTFNSAHYVRDALASALSQSYHPLEIIVVDNYSVDDTPAIVASFTDPRIRLFSCANHGVIAASRNYGVRQARGDWVAFCDSDDVWRSDKLAVCSEEFDKADLIYHDCFLYGELTVHQALHRRVRAARPHPQDASRLLRTPNRITLSSVVIRRESLSALGGFDENVNLRGVEDFDLWIRAAQAGLHFRSIHKPLAFYRLHAASVSSDGAQRARAHVALYRKSYPLWGMSPYRAQVRSQLAYLLARSAVGFPRTCLLVRYALLHGGMDTKLKALQLLPAMLFRRAAVRRHT